LFGVSTLVISEIPSKDSRDQIDIQDDVVPGSSRSSGVQIVADKHARAIVRETPPDHGLLLMPDVMPTRP
jgi:hypothetical protein